MTAVKKAAVIGTGTMGPGMGAVLERAGMEVALYDVSEEQLEKARPGVELARCVLDRLGGEGNGAGGAELRFEADLAAALDGVDLVVEAVPEKLELKQQVFADFEQHVSPDDAILASNTSGIPITKIAEGLEHPERVDRHALVQPAAPDPDDRDHPRREDLARGHGDDSGAGPADRLLPVHAQEGGARLRREPRPLRDHARVPRARRRGRRGCRGARPQRQVGHRLQARRGPADAAARHGRARHLQRGRELPEPGPLRREGRLQHDHRARRPGQARDQDRRRPVRLRRTNERHSSRRSAPRRSWRSARR